MVFIPLLASYEDLMCLQVRHLCVELIAFHRGNPSGSGVGEFHKSSTKQIFLQIPLPR